ncbi:MAG: DNA recombination protein RmuC [Woeseiaceae bacterium]|nr:DNA recombination protein RmuC [Woeseiaceae bacterium]
MLSLSIDPVFLQVGLPALGIGLLVGALIVWLIARRRSAALEQRIKTQEAMREEREQAFDSANALLTQAFSDLSNKSLQDNSENFLRLAKEHLGAHNEKAKADLSEREKAIESLVKPIRDALESSKKQIGELENSRREAYGDITAQLKAMQTSQQMLSQETQNLVNALRRPEVRGRWGEITLKRLVELAGMVEHCDFEEQVHTVGEDQVVRPDLVVHLPDGGELVVDVKTPLDAYLAAIEAKDDAQRKLGLEKHAKNVRAHIRMLSGKAYWSQFEQSPEFVILFIPGDQFLSAALNEEPDLIEYALAHHIMLATPTSLVALLKAVAYSWRQVALADNAKEIRKLAEDLYTRLGTFAAHLNQVGRQLGRSVDNYNKAVGSLERSVLPGARKFTELGVHEKKDIDKLEPIEVEPRRMLESGNDDEAAPSDDKTLQ